MNNSIYQFKVDDIYGKTYYFTELKGSYLLLLGEYEGGQVADDPAILRWIDMAEKARVKAMGIGSHFLPLEYPKETLDEVSKFFLEEE